MNLNHKGHEEREPSTLQLRIGTRRTSWTRRLVACLIAAAILLLVVRQASEWRQFDWTSFRRNAAHISSIRALLAVACIYAAFVFRAARWKILAGLQQSSTGRLLGPTFIGFAGVALLGRALEPMLRPWLISRREGVPFESQVLVWLVERIFDTGGVVLLVGAGLLAASGTLPYTSALRAAGVLAVLGIVVGSALLVVLARGAGHVRHRLGGVLGNRIARAATVLQALRSGSIAVAAMQSLAMWLLIAAAYWLTFQSFAVPEAHLTFIRVLVVMGFSIAGSLVPLPAAAGQQLAVAAALVAVFGFPSDLAVSCAILLWLTTWISVVPAGLVLLRREHLSLSTLHERMK